MFVSQEDKNGFRFKTMRKNETFRAITCATGSYCGGKN
jgi:hypothetical protein